MLLLVFTEFKSEVPKQEHQGRFFFLNTESQVLFQTYSIWISGRCISKASYGILMQPIHRQAFESLWAIFLTGLYSGIRWRGFLHWKKFRLGGLPSFFIFSSFSSTWVWSLVNVVYCLHPSVSHMPHRTEYTDTTWEHKPCPDQLCQSRIPASVGMTWRDAHANPVHSSQPTQSTQLLNFPLI